MTEIEERIISEEVEKIKEHRNRKISHLLEQKSPLGSWLLPSPVNLYKFYPTNRGCCLSFILELHCSS